MAEVQEEIVEGFAKMVAACLGVKMGGGEEILPYDPAVLEGMAEGKRPLG